MVTGFERGEGTVKANKKELLLTSLVCLLPLLAGVALYPRLPETMATHWGFDGTANGWSSRATTVFGLPLFILAVHLVCFYAESRDTKRKNVNPVLRTVMLWICPAMSLLGSALTLGTGLGGGIIFGGHMFNGGMNQGVELGHMYLVNGGEHCTCGNDGCMEAYCAASALARDGKRAMLEHPESLIAARAGGAADAVDAKLVIDCAKEGDETAKAVFDRYIDSLSSACASIYNLLDPEVIAIGGGVCGAGEFLFAPLRERTTGKCFYKTHGELIPAELGNDAGMIGAAMLHRDAQ